MPTFFLLDPLILLLLAIIVAANFDGPSAIAAVIAAVAAGIVLLNVIPLVTPLKVAPATIEGYRKSRYPRLALVRAIFLLLVWIAAIVLAGILIVRIVVAVL